MHTGACVTTWRNVTPERGSLAVWSFRWRVTPNHRWIQQSRHDGRSASKPSFISAGEWEADGKAGGHIIRLALAHRAPSSFSAVILDRAAVRSRRAASHRIALHRSLDARWIVAFDVATQDGATFSSGVRKSFWDTVARGTRFNLRRQRSRFKSPSGCDTKLTVICRKNCHVYGQWERKKKRDCRK